MTGPSSHPGLINSTRTGQPVLDVVDLSVQFTTLAGTVRAVEEVSLSLHAGETLGIVGESGSGKSVLARGIMGLNLGKNAGRSGRVVLQGDDITALAPARLRPIWGSRVAMVFQDPMTSLNPVMSIGRQLMEPVRFHLRYGRRQARQHALELLSSVGIPDPRRRFHDYPHQLSGGMRQRVVIALAISCNPALVLADEPTTALDVTVQAQILSLLAQLQRERGMAMILISHDLSVVSGRTDQLAVMYAGRIVEQGPSNSVLAHPRMPYTEALLQAIPKLEDSPHSRSMTIPGRPPNPVEKPTGCAFADRCRYAKPRCRDESPPLGEDSPGYRYSCWFPLPAKAKAAASENSAKDASLP